MGPEPEPEHLAEKQGAKPMANPDADEVITGRKNWRDGHARLVLGMGAWLENAPANLRAPGLVEDLKPSGLEAVQVKSGEPCFARELRSSEVERGHGSPAPALAPDPDDAARYTGGQRWMHQELRDRKVAFFLDKLPQGVWEIRYDLRAEAPGRFHALPVLGQAMYVPEIRCNGAETRLTVTERGVQGD